MVPNREVDRPGTDRQSFRRLFRQLTAFNRLGGSSMSVVFSCFGSDRTREQVVEPCCDRCEAPLTLHQPDPQLPDRLLAVCEECKAWYLSDSFGLVLTPIPIEDERRPRVPKGIE
jgi:hypothetical protein